MSKSVLGGVLVVLFAIPGGVTMAHAAPIYSTDAWHPIASGADVNGQEILASPDAPAFCNSIFCGGLRSQALREIEGVDSSRLTYIFRLWNYRLGGRKGRGAPDEAAHDDASIPAFTPSSDGDDAVVPVPDGSSSSGLVDLAEIVTPDPPIVPSIAIDVPEPSTLALGGMVVAAMTVGRLCMSPSLAGRRVRNA